MRLTHINSYYFSNRLHEELVWKLAESDLKQHVFLPLPTEEAQAIPACEGVSFSLLNCFSNLERALWPLKMRRVWQGYERDRKQACPDLQHAHSLIVNGLIAYWAKRKYGTPYVVTIRNTDVNHFLKKAPWVFRPIALRIMREAEAVITLSQVYWDTHMLSYLHKADFDEISKKHFMIPNGCEDFWFEGSYNRAELRSCLRLVFVGLLNDNKNLRGVLEACKLLSNKGVSYELKVVGNGPLEDILKIEAAELPVRFLGYVEDRVALRLIYQNSDVLVVPSRTESFGVVYAEAMTQGLPVIYTAGQGFDGLFSDGEVGFAVDPDDVEQIASCVLHIRDDYGKFSQRAKIRAFCFRWDHPVEKLLRLYRNALSSG